MSFNNPGFDRYGDAYLSAPSLLEPPDRRGPGGSGSGRGRRRRRQLLEEDELELAQYRQLQENAIRVPGMDDGGMFEDMTSPYFEEDLLSPRGRLREDSMLDIARSAPNELGMMMLARSDYERPPDMGVLDDMLAGFDALPYDMGIMDRDFDLFDAPPASGVGASSLFADDYPTIERGPLDPMAAFYSQPRDVPRRRRSRSITSGYRLPLGATSSPRMPRELRLQDRLMGTPQANMLLGARPLPDLGGTPMPELGDDEDFLVPMMPSGGRRRRR